MFVLRLHMGIKYIFQGDFDCMDLALLLPFELSLACSH